MQLVETKPWQEWLFSFLYLVLDNFLKLCNGYLFFIELSKKVLDFWPMLIWVTLICGVSQTVQTWTLSPSIKPIPALVRTNNSGSRKRTKTRKSYFSSPFETIFAFLPLTVSVIECHNLWTFEGQIGSTPTIQFFLSKKIKEKILNVFHTRLFFFAPCSDPDRGWTKKLNLQNSTTSPSILFFSVVDCY